MPEQINSFSPVFIVGCERSGTTLLAVLLDRHKQLTITPETHFCFKLLHHPWQRSGLLDRFYQWQRTAGLKLPRERLAARFDALPATPAGLFQAALQEYAAIRGKPRVGEKTPFHLWHVPRLLSWYPAAKVICIVRDGRDTVLSLLDAPWTPHQMVREHARRWVHAVNKGQTFQRRYPDRLMLVRYEDILTGPQATLTQIDAFLDLPFEPGQLDTGIESEVVCAWERAWKGNATAEMDATRIGKWRSQATPGQCAIMNSMMGKTLRRFGYKDTTPDFHSPITAWAHAFANLACRLGFYRLFYKLVLRNTSAGRAHRHSGSTPKSHPPLQSSGPFPQHILPEDAASETLAHQ